MGPQCSECLSRMRKIVQILELICQGIHEVIDIINKEVAHFIVAIGCFAVSWVLDRLYTICYSTKSVKRGIYNQWVVVVSL